MKKWLIRQGKLFICFIWGHDEEKHHQQRVKWNIIIYCNRCKKKRRFHNER